MTSKSMSAGAKIRDGLDTALRYLTAHRDYHDYNSDRRIQFNIKVHNAYPYPKEVDEAVEQGIVTEAEVQQHYYDTLEHELNMLVVHITGTGIDGEDYYEPGEGTLKDEVWFDGKDVFQAGRMGGWMTVPMPPIFASYHMPYITDRLHQDYADEIVRSVMQDEAWIDIAGVMKEARTAMKIEAACEAAVKECERYLTGGPERKYEESVWYDWLEDYRSEWEERQKLATVELPKTTWNVVYEALNAALDNGDWDEAEAAILEGLTQPDSLIANARGD